MPTLAYTFLLVLGSVFLWRGVLDWKRATQSVHWPMLDAEILSASVLVHRGGHTGSSYSPVLRYRYNHQGVGYEGQRLMFTGVGITFAKAEVEEFVSRFRPGDRISVRVCPTKPKVSVIQPGVDRRVWLTLFIGAALTSIGAAALTGKLK